MKILLAVLVTSSIAYAQTGSADAPAPEPPPAPAPADNTAMLHTARKQCADALNAADAKKDKVFIADVSAVAAGIQTSGALAKTPDGVACITAVTGIQDFRAKLATAASEAAAVERAEATKKEHEDAAKAIAKNEKHVVLAYAALWILAAGFLVFLWRRQQRLVVEIAQLKKDLESATK